jgi:hypothetical protein
MGSYKPKPTREKYDINFLFYAYWLMFGLPGDDVWIIKKCWRYNVVIIKLQFDIVHLVGCSKIVYKL